MTWRTETTQLSLKISLPFRKFVLIDNFVSRVHWYLAKESFWRKLLLAFLIRHLFVFSLMSNSLCASTGWPTPPPATIKLLKLRAFGLFFPTRKSMTYFRVPRSVDTGNNVGIYVHSPSVCWPAAPLLIGLLWWLADYLFRRIFLLCVLINLLVQSGQTTNHQKLQSSSLSADSASSPVLNKWMCWIIKQGNTTNLALATSGFKQCR